MAEIRRRAAQRRAEGGAAEPAHPWDLSFLRPDGSREGLDPELSRSLHQANLLCMPSQPHYVVGWRTPVLGQLWAIVRRRLHQEIRVYIDAQQARQFAYNSQVVRVLNRLAVALQAQAQELAALRAEVAQLRKGLSRLKSERNEKG